MELKKFTDLEDNLMNIEKKTVNTRSKGKIKKEYVRPEIKEVWNENIGLNGVYLLEM